MNTNAVAWGIFKWAVVPGALFAVGYFLFGPHIGEIPAVDQMASRLGPLAQSEGTSQDENTTRDPDTDPIPVVEVDVTVQRKN